MWIQQTSFFFFIIVVVIPTMNAFSNGLFQKHSGTRHSVFRRQQLPTMMSSTTTNSWNVGCEDTKGILPVHKMSNEQEEMDRIGAPFLTADDDERKDESSALSPPTLFQQLFPNNNNKPPPPDVEDVPLLLYDIFLLLNLTVSISFWVTHRYSFTNLGIAFSEGCLLSSCWILAGLYSGSFLYSAATGHSGNPRSSRTTQLALNTFVNTANLRLLFALLAAVVQHQPVGSPASFGGVETEMLGLELGFGMILMPVWRTLHGRFVSGGL